MVSAGTVKGHSSEVTEQLGQYDSKISELSSSWEGSSHDKLASEASTFSSDCKKISTGMDAFATACDLYEDYIAAKERKKTCESELSKAKAGNKDGINNDTIAKYNSEISELETKISNLKSQIEEQLRTAASTKIEGATAGALSAGSSTWVYTGSGTVSQLGADSGVLPNARIGDDARPDPSTNPYYQSTANGGINGFPLNGGGPGKGGNCTYYAYSRFSELLGKPATGLSTGDACSWYNGSTGYKKGQTPKLGAIAVWQYGNSSSNGHVAVVEEIKSNGDIVVSEGGWSNQKWYGNNTYSSSNNYATGYSNGHLLGFIYPEEA